MTLNPTFFIITVLSPELFPGSSFKTGPDWYRLFAFMEPEIQIVGFTLLDHPPCSPGAARGCRRSLVASSVLRNLPKTLCAHSGLRRVTLSWDLAGTLKDIPWLLAGAVGPPCPRRLLGGGWLLAVVPSSGRMRWQWGGCKLEIWGSRGLPAQDGPPGWAQVGRWELRATTGTEAGDRRVKTLLLLFLMSPPIQIWGWQGSLGPLEGQPVPTLGKSPGDETPANIPVSWPLQHHPHVSAAITSCPTPPAGDRSQPPSSLPTTPWVLHGSPSL